MKDSQRARRSLMDGGEHVWRVRRAVRRKCQCAMLFLEVIRMLPVRMVGLQDQFITIRKPYLNDLYWY